MSALKLRVHAERGKAHLDGSGRVPSLSWPYMGQFILGPRFVDSLPGWQRMDVAGGRKLSVHPDLAISQARKNGRELTLIGHLLDPFSPNSGNDEILQELLRSFSHRDALYSATASFGGRWLLIAVDATEAFLFHDAMGLRQAFYSDRSETGEMWVMSQPGIASEVMSLTPDPLAEEYLDTQTFRRTSEFRLPGAATTFKNLRHLLPNHGLDLLTGTSQRYWPAAPLEAMSPAAAIDRVRTLMTGQIRAAAARFDLALSLTAGIDSRLVLAMARDVVERVSIMTLRQGRLPDHHPDLDIPARLLKRLGLSHTVVHATSTMTPEFSQLFKRNVYLAHDHYGHDAEALLHHFGRSKAVLTGSGAEITRCPFRTKLPIANYVRFTPETLAWLEYDSTHPYLVAHFRDWLSGAGRQNHVPVLDLFEWEQDYGNWLAMTQLEFDTAWREIFTPYNCRALLATLLGVPERHRRNHTNPLFRRAIAQAWPELLAEPVNPHKQISRLARITSDLKAVYHYARFRYTHRRTTTHR